MEDRDTGPTAGAGFPIAAEALDLEVYQLACVFAASHEIMRWGKDAASIARLRTTFERSEASRRLITLAATLRNSMDSWSKIRRDRFDQTSGPVGTLTPNLQTPTVTAPLRFRDACNKLIHTEHINFDVRRPTGQHEPSLRPFVHLYGTRDTVEWKADLHMVSFLRCAAKVS